VLSKYKTEEYLVNGHKTLRLTCARCGEKFIVSKKINKINARGTSPCPYCYNTGYVEGGAYDELVQSGWKPGEPVPGSESASGRHIFRDRDRR
jgi:DNA-directed RNA polymerase subunit RPC12/RpoP